MIFLKLPLLSILLLSCGLSFASATEVEKDPLSEFSISKDEIAKTLENFRKEGKITEAEYLKTKKDLAGMDDKQVSDLNQKAMGVVKKDPEKANTLIKKNKIESETTKEAEKKSH